MKLKSEEAAPEPASLSCLETFRNCMLGTLPVPLS